MEWLKAILEKVQIGEDGKLNVGEVVKDIAAEFPKHAVPKAEFNEKAGELKKANDTIAILKKDNADNEALQKVIETHKNEISELKKESANTTKKYALQSALKEAGCTDPEYLIYKHGGIDKFAFGEDGKPIGIEDTVKPYKESNKVLFPTGQKEQNYDPRAGAGGSDTNPFKKDTWNMTEQGRLYKENPEQARAMANAAGVNI